MSPARMATIQSTWHPAHRRRWRCPGRQALLGGQQQRRPPGDETPEVVHHVERDVVHQSPPPLVRREDRVEPRQEVGLGHTPLHYVVLARLCKIETSKDGAQLPHVRDRHALAADQLVYVPAAFAQALSRQSVGSGGHGCRVSQRTLLERPEQCPRVESSISCGAKPSDPRRVPPRRAPWPRSPPRRPPASQVARHSTVGLPRPRIELARRNPARPVAAPQIPWEVDGPAEFRGIAADATWERPAEWPDAQRRH